MLDVVGTVLRRLTGRGGASGVASGGPVGYDAGRSRPGDPGFRGTRQGPNALADLYLPMTAARSRYLADNHPLIHAAIEKTIDRTLGEHGVHAQPATEWDEVNDRIEWLYWRDAMAVDVGRELSLRDVQDTFLRDVMCVGDVLVHDVFAPAYMDHAAGPAVQLIAAEQLEIGYNATVSAREIQQAGGVVEDGEESRVIRQSVEIDQYGRVAAYWVLKDIPNDGGLSFVVAGRIGDRIRIPRERAALAFVRRRTGQLRGVPMIQASVNAARELGIHTELVMQAAKKQALLSVFFKNVSRRFFDTGKENGDDVRDVDGQSFSTLSPFKIGILPPNGDVMTVGSTQPGPEFAALCKVFELQIASAVRLTRSQMTGDYSEVNFAASKAEELNLRPYLNRLQNWAWRSAGHRWYERKVAYWIATGELPLPTAARAAWLSGDPVGRMRLLNHGLQRPGFGWVDPLKEANAMAVRLKEGMASLQHACAELGLDWREVIDQQVRAEAYEAGKRREAGLPPRGAVQNENRSTPTRESPDDGGDSGGDSGGEDGDENSEGGQE